MGNGPPTTTHQHLPKLGPMIFGAARTSMRGADRAQTIDVAGTCRPHTGPRRAQVEITPELVAAFRADDVMAVHVAIGWKPWEMSPMQVQNIPQPDLREVRGHPFFSSWWSARALRDALEAAAAMED
jgi:hypothetical protein